MLTNAGRKASEKCTQGTWIGKKLGLTLAQTCRACNIKPKAAHQPCLVACQVSARQQNQNIKHMTGSHTGQMHCVGLAGSHVVQAGASLGDQLIQLTLKKMSNYRDVHDILWNWNDLEHICQDMLSDNSERLFTCKQVHSHRGEMQHTWSCPNRLNSCGILGAKLMNLRAQS